MKHTYEAVSALLLVCVYAMMIWITISPSQNKIMELGDEVETTDEYNTLFNESFSGRIVSIDGLYTVRDENGTERMFEWKWINPVDVEP